MSQIYYADSRKDDAKTIQALLDSCAGQEAVIVFREGDYYFEKGLTLTKEHRNLILRGEGKVRFIGGKKLSAWKKVAGSPEAARFDEDVRDCIYVCDLAEAGIPAAGVFQSRRGGRTVPSHSELFINTVPMNLSQYPKGEKFLTITGYGEQFTEGDWNRPVGKLEGGFYYEDQRPKRWAASDQLWTLGYWGYDWSSSVERIQQLDAEKGFVRTFPPHGEYFYRKGQRFRFYHVMEEVNRPGDYYIDYEGNKAYIYPERMDDSMEIMISLLEEPLLSLQESKDILVEGIAFEMVRAQAVQCEYTEDVIFDHCLFRNIGCYALEFLKGKRNCIRNSDIHDCGESGIIMLGGDRRTLESAEAVAENNHIYRVARWLKCYHPGISMVGVGMTARHNLIHDCPHTAVMYWGNEMTIEDNEIYNVVMDTADAGAVYTGRDYTFRGNRVNHNYIHHLGRLGQYTMAIYNDDGASGTEMNDNFFEEVYRGAFMGGGRDYVVRNNVFVKCFPAIDFDSREADERPVWRRQVEETLRERLYTIQAYSGQGLLTNADIREMRKVENQGIDLKDSVYLERYPELQDLDRRYQNPVDGEVRIPASARVESNVFCSRAAFAKDASEEMKKSFGIQQDIHFNNSGERGELYWIHNYQAVPEEFEDAKWGNLALKPDSKAFLFGHTDSDFASIGLEEEKRRENPPKARTCIYASDEKENTLVVGVKNIGRIPVAGFLRVYSTEGVELSSREIAFVAAPGEEKEYTLEVVKCSGIFELEVRSDVAGVRPSRGIFDRYSCSKILANA